MLARIFQVVLIFAVPLLFAACDSPQATPREYVAPTIAQTETAAGQTEGAAPSMAAPPSSLPSATLPSATPDLQYQPGEIPPARQCLVPR